MPRILTTRVKMLNGEQVTARLEDEPGRWGTGSSLYEAVGDLVCNHPEAFGLTITDGQPDPAQADLLEKA